MLWYDRLVLHPICKFIFFGETTCVLNVKQTRVNGNIELPKRTFFELVADQYHNNCQGLNSDSMVSG